MCDTWTLRQSDLLSVANTRMSPLVHRDNTTKFLNEYFEISPITSPHPHSQKATATSWPSDGVNCRTRGSTSICTAPSRWRERWHTVNPVRGPWPNRPESQHQSPKRPPRLVPHRCAVFTFVFTTIIIPIHPHKNEARQPARRRRPCPGTQLIGRTSPLRRWCWEARSCSWASLTCSTVVRHSCQVHSANWSFRLQFTLLLTTRDLELLAQL